MERLTIRNSDGTVSQPTGTSMMAVFSRLAHYEDLEEQGRLVVLPCKVGDTVYVINRSLNRVFECTVISIRVGHSTDLKNYIKTKWVGANGNESIRKWTFRQIGRYVFLTREEAERALEGGVGHD